MFCTPQEHSSNHNLPVMPEERKEPNPVGRDRHEVQLDVTAGFHGIDDLYGHDEEVLRRQRW